MAEADGGPVDVSVVIPTHRSTAYLTDTWEQTVAALDASDGRWELIVVDDASDDGTWDLVRSLAARDERTLGLRLADNVGQIGALLAGFTAASAPVLVAMDDDLDVDPMSIPPLVAALGEGVDLASGSRTGRRPLGRAIGSSVYNAWLRSSGVPLDDGGCGTAALTAALGRELVEAGWRVRGHRFKPAAHLMGAKVVDVEVGHPPRSPRPSTYRLSDLAASWVDVARFLHGRGDVPIGRRGPVLLAAAVAVATLAVGAIRRPMGLAPLVAAAATSFVAFRTARSVTTKIDRSIERARAMAPFDIVDRCGGPEHSPTRVASLGAPGTPRHRAAPRPPAPAADGRPDRSRS